MKIEPYKNGFRGDGSRDRNIQGKEENVKFGEPAKLPIKQNIKEIGKPQAPAKPDFKKKPPVPNHPINVTKKQKPTILEDSSHKQEQSITTDSTSKKSIENTNNTYVQPKKQSADPTLYKLLDRIKQLTESNQTLQKEKSKLELKLQTLEAPLILEENLEWSLRRDKMIKHELMRLRIENYKLKSSMKVNERFGELIVSLSRDFNSMIDRMMEFTEETCKSQAANPNELIGDIASMLIRLNNNTQSINRDFLILKEENGSRNAREWDCAFSQTDIHSEQELAQSLCTILMDFEGKIQEKIRKIEKKVNDGTYSSEDEILKQSLIEECQLVLNKAILVNNFSASKSSAGEFKKRLKAVQRLNIEDSLVPLKNRIMENVEIMRVTACTHETIRNLVTMESESVKSKLVEARSSDAILRIGCLLSYIEHISKVAQCAQDAMAIRSKMDYFIQRVKSDLSDPIFELFNFLDRQGLSHEVYLAYRQKLIYNLNLVVSTIHREDNLIVYADSILAEVTAYLCKNPPLSSTSNNS